MAHQQIGEPAAAIAALKKALVIDPLAAEILIRLGDLLRAAGESRAAETHYLRAAQDADWRGRALLRQAVMAAEAGRYRAAVTLLEEARQADIALSVGRYLTAVRSLADRAE